MRIMKRIRERIEIILVAVLIAVSFVSIFPFERIYIKESKPTQFLPDEYPLGLIEASNNYIVLSYGTLLKQQQEEFFVQFFKFNSSEYASSYFSEGIEYFKKSGIEFNLTSFNDMQEATIYRREGGRELYSVTLLKENKIFYFTGDKIKIEKVIKWFINQNS